jgi:hypothetical protein
LSAVFQFAASSDWTYIFSTLEFAVLGAIVTLTGWYGLHTETLDFHGRLELAARRLE